MPGRKKLKQSKTSKPVVGGATSLPALPRDIFVEMIQAGEEGGFYSMEEYKANSERMQADPDYSPTTIAILRDHVLNSECCLVSIAWDVLGVDQQEEWVKLLMPMARSGSLGAQLLLAQKFTFGCGLPSLIERTEMALEWMESAADKWSHPNGVILCSNTEGWARGSQGTRRDGCRDGGYWQVPLLLVTEGSEGGSR